MKNLKDFLIINGFEESNDNIFYNRNCNIILHETFYEVYINKFEGTIYSSNVEIYWLIGVLTYYNLIDKNYIK